MRFGHFLYFAILHQAVVRVVAREGNEDSIFMVEGYHNFVFVPSRVHSKNDKPVWIGVNNVTGELLNDAYYWWFSADTVWNAAYALSPGDSYDRYGYTTAFLHGHNFVFSHGGGNIEWGVLTIARGQLMTACVPVSGTITGQSLYMGEYTNVMDCAEEALMSLQNLVKGVFLVPKKLVSDRVSCWAAVAANAELLPSSPYEAHGHLACLFQLNPLPGVACCGTEAQVHTTTDTLQQCAEVAAWDSKAISWNVNTRHCHSYHTATTVDSRQAEFGWRTAFLWQIRQSTTSTTTTTVTTTIITTATATTTVSTPGKSSSTVPIAAAGGAVGAAVVAAAGGALYYKKHAAKKATFDDAEFKEYGEYDEYEGAIGNLKFAV